MDNFYHDHKLEEGAWYDFKIVKIATMDDEHFYVLQTPINTRMLLPVVPYLSYSFKVGQTIRCKVDKVSCTGKIYIEPEHPYYQVDKSYPFPVVEVLDTMDLYHQQLKLLVLNDRLNHQIYLPLRIDQEVLPKEVELRIIRIKKSMVFALPNDPPFDYRPVDGEWHRLKVINAFEMGDEGRFYLFEDELKKWHLAPVKYFGKQLLSLHAEVKAKVSLSRVSEYYNLEFEHPNYPFGSERYFDIISEKTVELAPDKQEWQISVKIEDEVQNVNLPLSAKVNDRKILLKIGLIRKGKLQLEAI